MERAINLLTTSNSYPELRLGNVSEAVVWSWMRELRQRRQAIKQGMSELPSKNYAIKLAPAAFHISENKLSKLDALSANFGLMKALPELCAVPNDSQVRCTKRSAETLTPLNQKRRRL